MDDAPQDGGGWAGRREGERRGLVLHTLSFVSLVVGMACTRHGLYGLALGLQLRPCEGVLLSGRVVQWFGWVCILLYLSKLAFC